MHKVDVAIQSYKKPESLLYTLMCLKECCGDRIDTVYINDDCSGPGAAGHYTSAEVLDYFRDWTIRFRHNTRPVRWQRLLVSGYRPAYIDSVELFARKASYLARQGRLSCRHRTMSAISGHSIQRIRNLFS